MTAVARIIEVSPEVSLLTTGYLLPPSIPFDAGGANGMGRGPQWRDGLRFDFTNSTAYGERGVCPPGSSTAVEGDTVGVAVFEPFKLDMVEGCGWLTKPIGDEFLQTELAEFDSLVPALMARQLWSGDFYSTATGTVAPTYGPAVTTNPTLISAGQTITGGATAQHPVTALARLVAAQRRATGGKGGIIVHGPEELTIYLDAHGLIQERGGRYLGKGFAYCPGPNNPADTGGAHGPQGATQATNEVWLYATGRVEYALGPAWTGAENVGRVAGMDTRIYFDHVTNRWQARLDPRLGILRFNPGTVFAQKAFIPYPTNVVE